MNQNAKSVNWKMSVGISMMTLLIVTALAVMTGLWVLTAIPIGFLFGFFLQKGGLCGASAFSEIILMKDAKKLWGLWVCIVTGMVGFAALDLLDWVKLNPKPFTWLSMIIGGIVFGVGMVLAGGCVSGSLFKAGTGHLNSIVALLGIAIGIAIVEAGPLIQFNNWMKSHVIRAPDGGSVTLSSITGLAFWVLAFIITLLTIIGRWLFSLKKSKTYQPDTDVEKSALSRVVLSRRWKPWKAGVAIGLLGALAYLSSAASGRNYPLGVTHGVYHAQVLLTDNHIEHIWKPNSPIKTSPDANRMTTSGSHEEKPVSVIPPKKVNWWLVAGIISLVIGAWVAARLSGEAKLYSKPPDQVVIAILGGIFVGIGAAFAKGCVVGNIMSGWALMSIGTVVFGIATILANWITTYFFLMGGSLFEIKK